MGIPIACRCARCGATIRQKIPEYQTGPFAFDTARCQQEWEENNPDKATRLRREAEISHEQQLIYARG